MTTQSTTSTSVKDYLDKYDRHFNKLHGFTAQASQIISALGQQNANSIFLTGRKGSGKSALVAAIAQSSKTDALSTDFTVPATLKSKDFIFISAKELFKKADKTKIEEELNIVLEKAENESDSILVVEDIAVLMTNLYNNQMAHIANRLAVGLRTSSFQMIAMGNDQDPKELESLKKSIPNFERIFTHITHEEADKETTLNVLAETRARYEAAYHGLIEITDEADEEISRLTHKYEANTYTHLAQPERSLRIRDMILSTLYAQQTPQESQEIVTEYDEKSQELETLISTQEEKLRDSNKRKNGETPDTIRATLRKLRELVSQNKTEYKDEFQEKAKKDGVISLTVDNVQEVFTTITGLKVSRSDKEELERIRNAEDILEGRVMGQSHAVSKIAASYKKAQILKKKKRTKPVASYLFIGPSGVGKTELTLALADLVGDLVTLDMGEYDSESASKKMTGADPGLVGYEEGGKLTNEVRQKPNSVVLFDELEKAHAKVFDVLLAVLDKGCLTDNKGKTVDFTDTTVIMTSNFGAKEFDVEGQSFEESCEIIKNKMRAKNSPFKPEFLNRFTDVIFFNHLDNEIMYKIIEMNYRKTKKELEQEGVELTIDADTIKEIVDAKYNKENGVRVAKLFVTDKLEECVAVKLIEHQLSTLDTNETPETLKLHVVFNQQSGEVEVIEKKNDEPNVTVANTQGSKPKTPAPKAARL